MNDRKLIITIIAVSAFSLIAVAGVCLFCFLAALSPDAIAERQKNDAAEGKQNAAKIAVFPEPLAEGFKYQSGISTDTKIYTVRFTAEDDGYPWIELKSDAKELESDIQPDDKLLKALGYDEFDSGSIPICGKTLNYRIGHGSGMLSQTDLLIGHIIDWTKTTNLEVQVTSDTDGINLDKLKRFFASMRPLGSIRSAKIVDSVTDYSQAFKPSEVAASMRSDSFIVNQNGWLTAGVLAVANTPDGLQSLAKMIRRGADKNSFEVFFPNDGKKYSVGESDLSDLNHLNDSNDSNDSHDLHDLNQSKESKITPTWSRVITAAINKKFPNGEGVYGTPNAWQPAIQTSLETLIGGKIAVIRIDQTSAEEIANTIDSAMKKHQPVLFSVKGPHEIAESSTMLMHNSAYPILAFDQKSKTLEVPKARGSGIKNSNEHGKIPISELIKFGRYICYPLD